MKNLLIALIGLLMSLTMSACAVADSNADRDALIASYLEWRGGDAFTSLQSIVSQGEVETSGLTGTATLIQTRNGSSKTELDLSIVQYSQALTPDGGWILNTSGQVETMGEVPRLNNERALALAFALPLINAGDNVNLLPDEDRDGESWGVLRITYDDGDYDDLFVDHASGAMRWMRSKRDTQTIWNELTDWEMVDGVRLPGTSLETYENPAENITYRWAGHGVNMDIPSVVFLRPSTERKVVFADGATSTGWITFDNFRHQRIFLPATINGTSTDAILDSGAEMTVVDLALAEEIGLVGMGNVAANGSGGTAEVQFATGVTLQLGNMEMRDLTVAIIDLSALAPRLGRSIPVILGKELFNETIVDIDYPNGRIAFHHPDGWSYQGNGATVALPDLEGSRSVEISVEGRNPIRVGFDIGQGGALTLFEAYVDEVRLLDDGRPVSDQMSGGVGGMVLSPDTSVTSLTFGGVTFDDVPAQLAIDAEGSFDTTREQGNLGTDLFSRFHMIVNYGADELYLEPDEAQLGQPFDRERAGLQITLTADGAEVYHVMAGSPAAAASIAEGDLIVAINGAPVTDQYWENDQWLWSHAAPGTDATLQFADGREVTLTLANFY